MAFLADTPASHLAGAFKESVGGARKKCRHCMASFETMNACFTEEKFTLRNGLDHEEQLKLIENAPTKFLKYYSKLFGLTVGQSWKKRLILMFANNYLKMLCTSFWRASFLTN